MTIERIGDNSILVSVDENIYSEEVLYKCFYWYGNKYDVVIVKTGSVFDVKVSSPTIISPEHYESLTKRISRDLIDFKTRQIVFNETHLIKEILIAKAFSTLEEYDETPRGSISDM